MLNKTFSVSVRDDQSEPGKNEVTNLVHTQQVKLATNQGKKITLQKSHQSERWWQRCACMCVGVFVCVVFV